MEEIIAELREENARLRGALNQIRSHIYEASANDLPPYDTEINRGYIMNEINKALK